MYQKKRVGKYGSIILIIAFFFGFLSFSNIQFSSQVNMSFAIAFLSLFLVAITIIVFFDTLFIFEIYVILSWLVIVFEGSKVIDLTNITASIILVTLFFILMIISFVVLLFKINKRPLLIYGKFLVRHPKFRRVILKYLNIRYKYRFVMVIILYISLILLTIFSFAVTYKAYNCFALSHNFSKMDGLYWFTAIASSDKLISPDTTMNFVYFSSSTFFSVGYGDIVPIGNILKFLVQVEMLSNYLLTAIFIPWLFRSISRD